LTTIHNASRTDKLFVWNGIIDRNGPYTVFGFPPQSARSHWSLSPGDKMFVTPGSNETDYYFYASDIEQSDPQTGETSYPAYFWSGRIPSSIDVDVVPETQQVNARATPQATSGLVIRPNQKTLTSVQQLRFANAINTLNDGRYANLVVIHGGNAAHLQHDMHGMSGPYGVQRFLAWHRIYLLMFDKALKEVDPTVSLPYWDWVEDRATPSWMVDLKPTVVVPGPDSVGTVQVVRNEGDPATLPTPKTLQDVLSNRDFTSYTSLQPVVPNGGGLEGIHNGIHEWFPNSSMNSLPRAPADPIFWMHHANLDRIWQIWQMANPYQYPQLGLAGQLDDAGLPARTMDPWTSYDETSTRGTVELGYVYEQYPPSPPRGPGG